MSRLAALVIQCSDPYVAAPFWALALDMPPVAADAEKLATRSLAKGDSVLLRDPDGVTPEVWVSPATVTPGATTIHFDLQLDEPADLDRLVAAGAVKRWEVGGRHPWTVFEAPDGVLFCARHPV